MITNLYFYVGVVRVGVSSTPGKTKHFQTLMVSKNLMLCDCPGLVFPSFMNNTGEMLCSGILPINQMKDYISPASVISSRVPMHLLEAAYGLRIKRELDFKDNPDRPPTSHEMLCAYCVVKGFITNGTGRWDEFRACKDLLRDFNDGKILFVAPPMAQDGTPLTDEKRWIQESERTMMRSERVSERLALLRIREADEAAKLDAEKAILQGVVGAASSSDLNCEMVFDNGKFEFVEDEEKLLDTVRGIGGGEGGNAEEEDIDDKKREHKRLKHWGKKNKKLRDKNPYADGSGYVIAYSTNRSNTSLELPKGPKVKRQDPRQAYGTPFVRTTLPHHPSAVELDPITVAKYAVIKAKQMGEL